MVLTDRIGVNAVEKIFVKDIGWAFREQAEVDWGIDAHVEVIEESKLTGRLLALQIKSGASYFKKKGKNFVYYGDPRHLKYWTTHSLPVVIVLHNPETGLTVWQKVERHLVSVHDSGKWSIEIPHDKILSADAADELIKGVGDAAAMRRIFLTLDADLMRQVASGRKVFFRVLEWVNETLNFRQTLVFFDTLDKTEPDLVLHRWLPCYELAQYMCVLWPWVEYKYLNVPDRSGSSEGAMHDLEVQVNETGKAFLLLEKYYESGAEPPANPPMSPELDPDEDEDDFSDPEDFDYSDLLEQKPQQRRAPLDQKKVR
jgi:Domain of unknown function (DUF4365)